MTTVVITGFGAFTPLGVDAPSTWQAMLEGVSGAHTLPYEWARDLPTNFAAETVGDPAERIDRVAARRMDRSTQHAVIAALEAWADAGLTLGDDNGIDRDRLGVCCASGIGGMQSLLGQWDVQKEKGFRRVSPFTIPMLMANAPAANVGLKLGARAAIHTPVSACASSNEAISFGLDMLRLGRADIAVVGGTEAVIHPLPLAAFGQMQALSRRNDAPEKASRPWDVDRDGFVLGEGSAMMVIETLEHAQARGAKIYGTLAGAGISADSHDLVQPDPEGRGQASAMVKALKEADLQAADIRHINAHGTSTPQGDRAEAGSIALALGDTSGVLVNSTKSMTGHLLGGAGAVETFATVMALNTRTIPGTINIENLEPGLPVQIATSTTALPEGDLAGLNNSFGFGGHNVVIAVTNANQSRSLRPAE
ncbi:beta-ketoacyl-[acyl-carrier-protein] synthase family protein [Aestuariimicrobium sp. T2.26MG-19.2B]|uniref:beta-ketoacyl-[acyl-carrier-protein] synthase family protein n=1 Tax=Aestuariimicrobium sp. T2.26MG-19.2B TaxID=3040679 RepID=UPI002477C803|nr:beta-ketoacyl-[acyl-carrier-protein] synthase family protein [Aestuariimicrobium sp. T2.26MG-19.2B]CAI9411051.1 3-oxoacyl-[acyl-carrier-protein] synthase 2 [Aestuariimicrobium sp. T2.26MG-19.2B]